VAAIDGALSLGGVAAVDGAPSLGDVAELDGALCLGGADEVSSCRLLQTLIPIATAMTTTPASANTTGRERRPSFGTF
jgi:hypothetical protein